MPKAGCECEKLGLSPIDSELTEGVVKEADLLPTSTVHIYAFELAQGGQRRASKAYVLPGI